LKHLDFNLEVLVKRRATKHIIEATNERSLIMKPSLARHHRIVATSTHSTRSCQ
jgi:hypothetical protein